MKKWKASFDIYTTTDVIPTDIVVEGVDEIEAIINAMGKVEELKPQFEMITMPIVEEIKDEQL